MKPMLSRRKRVFCAAFIELMGCPNTSIVPLSASNIPAISVNSVVFPHPDGPTTNNISPLRASSEISCNTSMRVEPLPKPLQSPSMRTAGALVSEFIYTDSQQTRGHGHAGTRGRGELTLLRVPLSPRPRVCLIPVPSSDSRSPEHNRRLNLQHSPDAHNRRQHYRQRHDHKGDHQKLRCQQKCD